MYIRIYTHIIHIYIHVCVCTYRYIDRYQSNTLGFFSLGKVLQRENAYNAYKTTNGLEKEMEGSFTFSQPVGTQEI